MTVFMPSYPHLGTLALALGLLAFGVWCSRVNGAKPARAIAWLSLIAALALGLAVPALWIPRLLDLAVALAALGLGAFALAVLILVLWALSHPARAFNRLLRPQERGDDSSSATWPSSPQSTASSIDNSNDAAA